MARLNTVPIPIGTLVEEYARQMRAGDVFPPIRVWFDGDSYWLSSGFKRTAAAARAGFKEILAEVRAGTLEDARWDSYAANATNGHRRTPAETEAVIRRALQHPRAADIGNRDIARYLHIPETTVRRWRRQLSAPMAQITSRTVTRGGTEYTMHLCQKTTEATAKDKPRRNLAKEIEGTRATASDWARPLLKIIEHWVRGDIDTAEFLRLIEGLPRRTAAM